MAKNWFLILMTARCVVKNDMIFSELILHARIRQRERDRTRSLCINLCYLYLVAGLTLEICKHFR